jgi:ParB/RepB/Spo0J family partition protein
MMEVQQVPLSLIDPPLIPMREQMGQQPFDELCEDISRNGITCPLLLRDMGERRRVVYGHRRLEAAKVCGLAAVPAVVQAMDEQTEIRKMVSENTGREDVSDAEKGRHYWSLMEALKLNLEQVASMVGKSVQYVDERVSFVQCDSEIADANRDGGVNWIVAQQLLRVNPYTWARAMRCDVALCDADMRGKIDAHRKFLLDLCIRCGATGKVAANYVEQWKNSLVPVPAYNPQPSGETPAPAAGAQLPRCIVCGRDSNPASMVELKVHEWERDSVLKILRAAGMEVFS